MAKLVADPKPRSLWSISCPSNGRELSQCAADVLQNMDDAFTCEIKHSHREDEVVDVDLSMLRLWTQQRSHRSPRSPRSPRQLRLLDPETAKIAEAWAGATVVKSERHWKDGRIYKGDWHQDGWPSGTGELFVAGKDGGTFRGTWRHGKLEGQGEFLSTSGGGYVGEWSAGVKHGHGTQTWANGMRFAGTFDDGAICQGTLRMPNGAVRRLV
eukprot:Skav223822  [mRNA]  locus=scaffold3121:48760:49395:- [translate_table: standard]